MVTIISGATNKPAVSQRLKKYFQDKLNLSGYLYIGYPIIGTIDGPFPIDALFVSQEKGLIAFNLVEGRNLDGYEDAQYDCANKIEAKLKSYRQLMIKRTLCVDINIVTFAPMASNCSINDNDCPLCFNEKGLDLIIDKYSWDNKDYYPILLSVLQSISTIRKTKKREIKKQQSRGAIIRKLEDSIANLDNQQSRAVIETVEGVQRIRGLAGSGKTIVLALKAAYLHAQHPDWKIAVTFNTRSLKGQFRRLINTFYIEQTNEEPNWENLNIIHAWGAPPFRNEENNIGIYYLFCQTNNIEYCDFSTARSKYGNRDPFGKVCEIALKEVEKTNCLYDVILVDEAQDFSASFLRLCYEMLKEPKRLVYAYDELQNLRLQSLPSPEVIFGANSDGLPKVRFESYGDEQHDIILKKCYRNSRPVLVAAHALGFGIYREIDADTQLGLVQMFDQTNLWKDIGYQSLEGEIKEGERIILKRTQESSPEFLEKHSSIDDLLLFKSFNSQKEQDEWVATEIEKNLKDDELRPDDIIVINPDPFSTKTIVAPIRALLYQKGIDSHTAGVDTTPDIFFSDNNDSVAFTGIYRAKGNEAAMVYVVNSQVCFDSQFELAKLRNQLFTAITRSKAWVRVLGVGEKMDGLIKEYERIKQHDFKLDFVYPTQIQRDHMNIVNRDMSEAEKKRIESNQLNLDNLITDLENGKVAKENLNTKQIEKLLKLLNRN